MVINNLNLISVSFTPFKTNPPLAVNADGIAVLPIPYQGMKFVPWI